MMFIAVRSPGIGFISRQLFLQLLNSFPEVPVLLLQSHNVTSTSGASSNSIGGLAHCMILQTSEATQRQRIASDFAGLYSIALVGTSTGLFYKSDAWKVQ